MFAVPGWSVSADALEAEKPAPGSGGPTGAKAKKRKRGGAGAKEENVTAANVADLWGSVIEGKKPDGERKDRGAKRQRKGVDVKAKKGGEKQGEKQVETASGQEFGDEEETKNKKGRKGKEGEKSLNNGQGSKPEAGRDTTETPALSPTPSKLTPLQASMREKLISARFRHLNETLYTQPSGEAFGLFQESPELFNEYHEGFRRQVKVWPENPVDSFLQDIRTRAKIRVPGKARPNAPQSPLAAAALPRTAGACTIADLGCGDARLAASLQADKDKLRLDIKSYDLQSPGPLVTKADIANLPLEDGAVNVAIFCLALMGTNWLDFVEEAHRILHWKGELWVAEIKSRFGPVQKAKHAPVAHSVGNRRKPTKKEAQAKEASAAGRFERDLAVEVDGMDDRRRETDVSAFVEALKKRGFVLHDDRNEAVDLSNKMFVKMRFTKSAIPSVGKGAKPQEAGAKQKKIFGRIQADDEDDQAGANEEAILKPCVYKIR